MHTLSTVLILSLLVCISASFLFTGRTVKDNKQDSTPNYIRLRKNTGKVQMCTSEEIATLCSDEDEYSCVRKACQECVMDTRFNPHSYCMRMTSCVCSITRDPSCIQMVDDCY